MFLRSNGTSVKKNDSDAVIKKRSIDSRRRREFCGAIHFLRDPMSFRRTLELSFRRTFPVILQSPAGRYIQIHVESFGTNLSRGRGDTPPPRSLLLAGPPSTVSIVPLLLVGRKVRRYADLAGVRSVGRGDRSGSGRDETPLIGRA